MKGATTIQERLKDLRVERHLKLEELEASTGISSSALGSYENDKNNNKEINHGSLLKLAKFYGVSVDYILCLTENREQANTPLSELHLSDEMVVLLKSGRINNRLLCELATHKDFIKFLADIEVYVDGIASMQIQNLNSLVDTVRHEIIERYRPGEDDPYLRILQAAHIEDDEYFSHMIQDDISAIVRDIRAAHKSDSESAPPTTIAEELKQDLEDVANFKGSPLKNRLRFTASGWVSIITSCLMWNSGSLYISLKNRNSSKAMSARGRNGNRKCRCLGFFHATAFSRVFIPFLLAHKIKTT